ncbi:MAG: CTP synthase [Saprospiraceae bacterium]|jgi:CTP synthase
MAKTKYIFVTGGVASSLGKGILAASLAKLLQARGLSVTIQKLDPYLNVDPGTLNPYEHGECYVTDDGAETDLDLGHYERFLNQPTSQENNITTGKIYSNVINREREGGYLGKTVQIIPHITDEIKKSIKSFGDKEFDVVITEIGGTVGDIESLPYIESVRQMRWEMGDNSLVIHLTLLPYLAASGELKTKPTQHSVKKLLEYGLQPDLLVCRSEHFISQHLKNKIARFCNVEPRSVIAALDAPTIYDVPMLMIEQELDKVVLEKLNLEVGEDPPMETWRNFLQKFKNPGRTVKIGLIGKYIELKDSYKSIVESLIHAGVSNDAKVELEWIHSENITKDNASQKLAHLKGILVAPGFGERGISGKISAIQFARENKIPFLGICLGMQCAVVEFATNVLGLESSSRETDDKTLHPVIDLMESQKKETNKGGTMRLGAYPCELKEGSKAFEAYGEKSIRERHRHRYEFNNAYLKQFEENGMVATGTNPESTLVEIVEIKDHPWFVGVQYHPEYKSTVANPHPLFVSFVKATLDN